MSFELATWTAAGRAALASLLAVCLVWPLRHTLASARASAAAVKGLVLCAIAVPPLATAYAFATLLPDGLRAAGASEWLLVLLLAARCLWPVGIVAALAPPPRLDAAAAHALALAPDGSRVQRVSVRALWHLLYGSAGAGLLAFAAGFVLAFGDFELTARSGHASWTVWLFDAQAGGVSGGATLRRCALPVALGAVVVAVGLALGARRAGAARPGQVRLPSGRGAGMVAALALAVLAVASLVPLLMLVHDGAPHLTRALRPAAARRELGWSLAYGILAAALATALAGVARRRPAALLLCLPGLAGGLVVALGTRTLCPAMLRDTPLPALLALAVWLLPFAVLLRVALARDRHVTARHAAQLLAPLGDRGAAAAARLRRALSGQPHVFTAALLVPMAQHDVVIGSILAPPQAAPLTVRLHNLVHYGHSPTVSATMLVLVLAAAGTAGLLALGSRIAPGR